MADFAGDVVGAVEVDGIDLGEPDEALEVDRVGRLGQELGEIRLIHRDVGALGDLVPLHDLGVGNLRAIHLVDALLADPCVVPTIDLVEPHPLLGDGGVELHRDVDESEADRTTPDGAWHTDQYPRAARTSQALSRARATRSVPNAVRMARYSRPVAAITAEYWRSRKVIRVARHNPMVVMALATQNHPNMPW